MRNKTCGDCLYLHTDDGEPYYCVVKDLYHFYEKTDAACDDFEEKSDKDEPLTRETIYYCNCCGRTFHPAIPDNEAEEIRCPECGCIYDAENGFIETFQKSWK